MQHDDPLAGLRALHLPPVQSSWWSDLGFAVALGLALALIAALAFRALFRPRGSLRREALAAFETAASLPTPERRAAQAVLLRRVVKTKAGPAEANATGAAWAETLDRVFGTELFSKGRGRVFADGLYGRQKEDDPALDGELAALLARLKR
ncbi:DUF4381 domain-containing protein [Hansschlegelia quercus]|uniref:DUF4381 domain-containing protein n=1 Tax=Hansschlegelia quercus TaxID=2528245 RepID=A0A4Q9GK42_9HYPH|nr:DUF4381 domain-containing protein [Hansschlegelia quercus]TBN54542.1 DUF4381 domain-containing protein [Hansschlegelia quercus]